MARCGRGRLPDCASLLRGDLLFWGLPLQRMAAENVLKAVQNHPEAWTRVDAILEHSKNQQTKFFGLQARSAAVYINRHHLGSSCTCQRSVAAAIVRNAQLGKGLALNCMLRDRWRCFQLSWGYRPAC